MRVFIDCLKSEQMNIKYESLVKPIWVLAIAVWLFAVYMSFVNHVDRDNRFNALQAQSDLHIGNMEVEVGRLKENVDRLMPEAGLEPAQDCS